MPSVNAAAIPSELSAIPQWVAWRYEERDGRKTKVPYCAAPGRGGYGSSTNPSTWTTFDVALAAYTKAAGAYDGIGLVLTDDLGIVGVDLDHVSEWEPEARLIVDTLDSYTEVTPSGDGYRVFVYGRLPEGRRRKGYVEMYSTGRFLTVTGQAVRGDSTIPGSLRDDQQAIDEVHAEFVADAPRDHVATPRPASGALSNLADAEVVARAKGAANGEAFARLWDGDTSAHGNDHSAADLALASHLAFWTGGDEARIDALFRQSGLMREKWERDDYRQWTLSRAVQRADFYSPKGLELAGRAVGQAPAQGVRQQVQLLNREPHDPPESPRSSHDATVMDDDGAGYAVAGEDGPRSHNSESYPMNDLGNAQRLVARHGNHLRYVHAWGKWLAWDGHRWEVDETGAVMRLAAETTKSIYLEAAATGVTAERAQALSKWANASMNVNRLKAMVDLARSMAGIPVRVDDLDQQPWKVNFANGTLDLRHRPGELYFYPNDPNDLITKVIYHDFESAAQAPRWEQFLLDAMQGDAELVTFLQRSVGYSITGQISERCLWVLHGSGRNGKSTFVETLQAILGDYALNTPTSTLMAKDRDGGVPNDVARLVGARFITAAETGDGKRLDEAGIKALTGGDTLTARFMRGEFFSFKPTGKLWLSTNHKPQIRGTDKGIWDRIRLVPFARRLEEHEQDAELSGKLLAEAAGILAWAVRGCMAWQAGGLTKPRAVAQATSDYQEEMDALGAFLADRTEVDESGRVPAGSLYHAYREWTEEAGEFTLSQRRFGMQLRERGFQPYKADSVRGWMGVRLIGPRTSPAPTARSLTFSQPVGLPWAPEIPEEAA